MKITKKIFPVFSVLLFLSLALSSTLPFVSKVYGRWIDSSCICTDKRDPNGVCYGNTNKMCESINDPDCAEQCSLN